jgi:glucosamine-6-phosphate deaminase
MRRSSRIAKDWWDFTTLDKELLEEASRITIEDIQKFSRPGFKVKIFNTLESFFLTEAFEYVHCWKKSTKKEPSGICGPIGPVHQLSRVADIINNMDINLKEAHYWGMDDWYIGESEDFDLPPSLSIIFRRLCYDLIREDLRMPEENLHFVNKDNINEFSKSFDELNCLIMQGGQGRVKHWAYNDPVKRVGKYKDIPPTPEEYKEFGTRIVDIHPLSNIQVASYFSGGDLFKIPDKGITVGPIETWKCDKVSIWHPGYHDDYFGMRLTTLMISKKIMDSSVPISLLASHPDVTFNFFRGGFGSCEVDLDEIL